MMLSSPRALHQGGASRYRFLRRLLEIPGHLIDIFDKPQRHPWSNELTRLEDLEKTVRRSARGNGYLSLEEGLNPCWFEENLVTWASWKSTLFIVGGVHGTTDFASGLHSFRHAAHQAGFRRALAFPVDWSEVAEFSKAGFEPFMVGSEATLIPRDFSLAGVRHADLRQMVNRGRKRYGLKVEEVLTHEKMDELALVYRRWLASRLIRRPMRLVVGTPCFHRLQARRVFAVQDEKASMCAFITLTPGWEGQGYGIDVMARAPDAPAGAMEVLISTVIQRLADEGSAHFTLGACPMFEAASSPVADSRILRSLCRKLFRSSWGNRLFPFRALAHFKSKFDPIWRPVYLAASPRVDLMALYQGCRMWGLFGQARVDPPQNPSEISLSPDGSDSSWSSSWHLWRGKKA